MKVERKKCEAFEPITITLETEQEGKWMQVITCIKVNETLKECCKREKQECSEVDAFGADLISKLDDFLDC